MTGFRRLRYSKYILIAVFSLLFLLGSATGTHLLTVVAIVGLLPGFIFIDSVIKKAINATPFVTEHFRKHGFEIVGERRPKLSEYKIKIGIRIAWINDRSFSNSPDRFRNNIMRMLTLRDKMGNTHDVLTTIGESREGKILIVTDGFIPDSEPLIFQ